jgi:3,4-dihydroxy 2-butanone 4-phosphate synthase/GTP cyclohydrolase II
MTPTQDPFVVFHPDPLVRVERAMEALKAGRPVIMVDDEDRENEGDIVYAAECITPEAINFMAVHARGLICLSITASQVDRLGLPMMATQNQSAYNTAFTVSIEAREGVTTGISAADRAHTILTAIRPDVHRADIVTPGHVFPLRARDGGVLERVGQTEGSVDLARLAGLQPAAVICEIINLDGTMSRLPELLAFGEAHRLVVVAVADLIKYRMQRERIVSRVREGSLDVPGLGSFQTTLFRGRSDGLHLAVHRGLGTATTPWVRVQGAPPAWTFLAPEASHFAGPAHRALAKIAAEGAGALVLMHLGGRSEDGITSAFDRDFEAGEGRVPAQASADALRDLGTGCQILRDLGIRELNLLTTSPRALPGLEAYGLQLVSQASVGGPFGVAAATGSGESGGRE